jgi:hypothetical protein
MLGHVKRLYEKYKEYVRVDLIMYGVLILMIVIYLIISAVQN